MWQGISDPNVTLCRNMAVVKRVGSRRETCSVVIGAGERQLGVSVCSGRTKPNGKISKSPLAHKVKVDASASLLKRYLKHSPGLEAVGQEQEAALWAGAR